MNKVLLVGGSGFLGKNCLKNLEKHDVTIIGRQALPKNTDTKSFKYHQLDIYDQKLVEVFLKENKFSHLLFLSWPASLSHNSTEHLHFAATSISFLKEFIKNNPDSRITFSGTIHETGINEGKIPNTFEKARPKTLYGIGKKLVYDCIQVLLTDYKGVSFCWARLSNIYGIGDHFHKILPKIIRSILQNQEITLNCPTSHVDFIHIDDAAHEICLALFSDYIGIMNIGSGSCYSLQNIIEYVKNRSNIINAYPDSKYGAVLNIEDSNKRLNYTPLTSIEEGINQLLEFYKN